MIQRIQSVYLLLAGVFPALAFIGDLPHWCIAVLLALLIALPLYTIFRFANRKQQVGLCNCNFALVALYAIAYGFICYQTAFSVWLALPLVSLVFVWLARRAIKRDEALVRAADRIR